MTTLQKTVNRIFFSKRSGEFKKKKGGGVEQWHLGNTCEFLQIDWWGTDCLGVVFPAALPRLPCMLEFQRNHRRSSFLEVKHLASGFSWVGTGFGQCLVPWVGVEGLNTKAVLLWPCCGSFCACFLAFHDTTWLCRNAVYLHRHTTAGNHSFASPKSCWTLKPGSTYLVTAPEAQQLNASPHHWTLSFLS